MFSKVSQIFMMLLMIFTPTTSLVNPCQRYKSHMDFSLIYRDCVARLKTNDLYIHTSDSLAGELFCCRTHPLKNRFFKHKK